MLNHIRPDSVLELLEAIDKQYYHIFAGGTDLMIRKRQWQGAERKFDKNIVFINHLDELKGITETDDSYEIMTLVTQAKILISPILPEYIKIAYSQMANVAVRNVATVGGNIVNAASVGDSLPVLYALNAKLVLRSITGTRTLSIDEFILGKYKTVKKQNEILEKIIIPKDNFDGFYYKKLGQRKASILSKLSVFIVHNEKEIRIAIGGVNETIIRLPDAEKKLVQTGNINEYMNTLEKTMNSVTDKRSTKDYKEQIALKLIKEYLEEMMGL